jgi:hypothetical protein
VAAAQLGTGAMTLDDLSKSDTAFNLMDNAIGMAALVSHDKGI